MFVHWCKAVLKDWLNSAAYTMTCISLQRMCNTNGFYLRSQSNICVLNISVLLLKQVHVFPGSTHSVSSTVLNLCLVMLLSKYMLPKCTDSVPRFTLQNSNTVCTSAS
eukprot:scpid103808/ scgid21072/ 